MATSSRAMAGREARRRAQFAKFRIVELNLVPLVDTFVSIVFFSLATATIGEMSPVVNGVTLPESRIGTATHQEITLAVASQPAQVVFNGRPLMSVQEVAAARSTDPGQPLLVPALFSALKTTADSIRLATNVAADQSIETPLAIQGDRTMRYDLLQRLMQTARLAGFKNLTLQVHRLKPGEAAEATTTTASRS